MLRHESYRRGITRIAQVPEIESLGFIAHTNPANRRGAIAAGVTGDSDLSVTLLLALLHHMRAVKHGVSLFHGAH